MDLVFDVALFTGEIESVFSRTELRGRPGRVISCPRARLAWMNRIDWLVSRRVGRRMDERTHPTGLYPRLLGDSWAELAEAVRGMHCAGSRVQGLGFMRVSHGANRLVRWLAVVLRLPAAGEAVPVTLVITPSANAEEWRRTFAGMLMVTRQSPRSDGLLAEQVGLTELRFRLEVRAGGLHYLPVGATLRLGWLRVPLPRWLAPTVTARETPAGPAGQIEVLVRVRLPVLGLLISYEGWITLSTEDA
jgi:hypothetical protein